jgi:photosystem II stability/assembly factor-like uncharacterized protein
MRSLTRFIGLGAAALSTIVGWSAPTAAQTRTASAQAQYKGVLEPVSYTEDLDLTDVFFVTADVGWVAGKSGTILRTVDGGKTWEAQLGGDPQDQSEAVRVLHFLDERRGWAIQGMKTLFTRDGESWEEIGSAPYGVDEMAFVSPRVGFVAGSPQATHVGPQILYRTTDGGRSWQPVWTCAAKVALGGVTKNISCEIADIQFPSPTVGYAVATAGCAGRGYCQAPPLLAKTTDGGETWQILTGPGVFEQDFIKGIFFLDENTGYARLGSGKLHVTADGGKTWRGIVASPGEAIQFADPMVGWGVELGWSELRFSYTSDGGRRWSSRSIRLPETVKAYSMPRRDRAYIVGTGGMIFRYRVIPAAQPLVANAVAAPAMPAFESAIDEQVAQLEEIFEELTEELDAAAAASQQGKADGAGGATAQNNDPFNADSLAAIDSAAVWNEPFEAPLPPASGFTANCCKKSFSRLELTLAALSTTLPEFVGKYKNLNLLLAAVRMGAELPAEYRALKGDLRTFRRAQDKESAQAALASVIEALSALKQTTAIAMQQELPPVPEDEAFMSESGAASAASSSAGDTKAKAKAKEKDGVVDAAKEGAKQGAKEAAKDAAKKGIGNIFKRKP